MIQAVSLEEDKPVRMAKDRSGFNQITEFIGTRGTAPTPQAFLVEQNAGYSLRTHYHDVHQFQLVARGDGTLGRHHLGLYSLHYASPESAYGPIVAGPDGLWYFTLRPHSSQTLEYLDDPGTKEKMRRGLKKKQAMSDAPAVSDPSQLRSRSDLSTEVMIEPKATGLAAWYMRVPPGVEAPAPVTEAGAGRYCVVTAGSLILDAKTYPPLSVVWVDADEKSFQTVAGPEGLEVVVMQFPTEDHPAVQ